MRGAVSAVIPPSTSIGGPVISRGRPVVEVFLQFLIGAAARQAVTESLVITPKRVGLATPRNLPASYAEEQEEYEVASHGGEPDEVEAALGDALLLLRGGW